MQPTELTPQSTFSAAPALSDVDERRFGVRTAKAVVASEESIEEALASARALGAQLLIARTPADAWSTAQRWIRLGAELVDVLCYFVWAAADSSSDGNRYTSDQALGIATRYATEADAAQIGALARDAFAGYLGHYHRDPRLDRCAADAVYPDWAASMCRHATADSPVILLCEGRTVCGFAGLRSMSSRVTDVALFAVRPASRGRGFGGALLRAVQQHIKASDAQYLSYSTQVENVTAQRLVVSCGFAPSHSLFTFHYWLTAATSSDSHRLRR